MENVGFLRRQFEQTVSGWIIEIFYPESSFHFVSWTCPRIQPLAYAPYARDSICQGLQTRIQFMTEVSPEGP